MTAFDTELPDIWGMVADQLDPTPSPYRDKPVLWVRERIGEHLTLDQRKIARSVVENRYTAVKSCHDAGKSHTASRIAAYWIDTHDPGDAFVVTTAPTTAQVKAILWREIGRAHRKGNLPGRITGDAEWKYAWGAGPDELIAFGRKPADYDPSAFQGIHARYVLIIIDEAGGVPKPIFDAVDSLATNEYARVLAIGNPDDPTSHFAKVCKPGSGWNVIRINGLESPNFTREGIEGYPLVQELMARLNIPPSIEKIPDDLRPLLISPLWVEERIKRWGTQSPLFVSKVLGEFPEVSHDSLIEPAWIVAAQNRELKADILDASFGVDVARYGNDSTIISLREGGRVRIVYENPKTSVTRTAGEVIHAIDAHPASPPANVDDVGVGGGVTDILEAQGYPVRPLIGQARSTEFLPNGKTRFVNKRAEWYWALREDFRLGHIDIDPTDDELAAQLSNIKYGINSSGQIYVESKEDMRKRGVDSPDRADSVCYSWVKGVFHAFEDDVLKHHAGGGIMGNILDEAF